MAGDILNDLTFVTQRVTYEEARIFMKHINNKITDPNIEYVVRDVKTGDRVYFT